MLTLVLGGARSGKSRFAQSLCPNGEAVAYIATARPEDDEMRARVERHRADRPAAWITIEEPLALAEAVRRAAPECGWVLIDCLTVWLSNLCWALREHPAREVEAAACAGMDALAEACAGRQVIVVSNEVGSGIVPDHPLGRAFRDIQGLVNQRAAAAADRVFLTVAGIPWRIKPAPQTEPES